MDPKQLEKLRVRANDAVMGYGTPSGQEYAKDVLELLEAVTHLQERVTKLGTTVQEIADSKIALASLHDEERAKMMEELGKLRASNPKEELENAYAQMERDREEKILLRRELEECKAKAERIDALDRAAAQSESIYPPIRASEYDIDYSKTLPTKQEEPNED